MDDKYKTISLFVACEVLYISCQADDIIILVIG